jgi:hypothetical protein
LNSLSTSEFVPKEVAPLDILVEDPIALAIDVDVAEVEELPLVDMPVAIHPGHGP